MRCAGLELHSGGLLGADARAGAQQVAAATGPARIIRGEPARHAGAAPHVLFWRRQVRAGRGNVCLHTYL